MALKFAEHFLWIANALIHAGDMGMWDEEDGFFYDVLRFPDGRAERLKVRSMVGLLPLCAVTVFDGKLLDSDPELRNRYTRFLNARPELRAFIHDPLKVGQSNRRLASALDESKLRRVLATMLDEKEFLGPHGIRALSRFHLEHPYVFHHGGQEYRVGYVPGDSDSGMFGGNSNWRGPVWMPVNFLLWTALVRLAAFYGDRFKIECPTGSGKEVTLFGVARELAERLTRTFTLDASGRRPVFGGAEKFQTDLRWRDNILFYEYFHGDNGAGIGASHQTGWTGGIARMIQVNGYLTEELLLAPDLDERLTKIAGR